MAWIHASKIKSLKVSLPCSWTLWVAGGGSEYRAWVLYSASAPPYYILPCSAPWINICFGASKLALYCWLQPRLCLLENQASVKPGLWDWNCSTLFQDITAVITICSIFKTEIIWRWTGSFPGISLNMKWERKVEQVSGLHSLHSRKHLTIKIMTCREVTKDGYMIFS